MKIVQTLVILLLFIPKWVAADVFDVIKSDRAGIILANTTIFSDTTFSAPTNQYFSGGSLVTVLKESNEDHEDDAQKQLFKWYNVTNADGKKGWVFGDAILVKENQDLLPDILQTYLYQKFRFNSGFENSMIWFGSIVGRDNFGGQMLSRNYEEFYLIITNQVGRSVFIPIASDSQFGNTSVETFSIQELTGDQTPEIVVQTAIANLEQNPNGNQIQKVVNLFTFQAGTLRKVFEERLNHGNQYKHLVFEKGLIRGNYFDVNEGLSPELYSFTYFWNKRSRQYEMLYPPAPSALRATPKTYGIDLKSSPDVYANNIERLNTASQLRVINLVNQSYTERGETYSKSCAEVFTDKGQRGFVPFDLLVFSDFDNIEWIKANLSNTQFIPDAISCIQLPELAADTSSIR